MAGGGGVGCVGRTEMENEFGVRMAVAPPRCVVSSACKWYWRGVIYGGVVCVNGGGHGNSGRWDCPAAQGGGGVVRGQLT